MKFATICLSALPSNPVERTFEADNIKEARKMELKKLIEKGEIDLDFMADVVEGRVKYDDEVLEMLYDYQLDPLTCRSIDTINDHDIFQILEGLNVYVIEEEWRRDWTDGKINLNYEGD